MGNSEEPESVDEALDEYLLIVSQAALIVDRGFKAALIGTAFDTEQGRGVLEIARKIGRAEGAQRIFGKAVVRLNQEGQDALMMEMRQLGKELFGEY
jgi:methionine synthase I (cobalamin-dependent)